MRGAPPNLCAWIAPIRFCRLHSLTNPICPSRQRCRQGVEGWAQAVSKIGDGGEGGGTVAARPALSDRVASLLGALLGRGAGNEPEP